MRRSSEIERSMINATAMMDVNSSGQIGQPAAWMMANKALSFET